VDIKNKKNKTALSNALQRSHTEVAIILILTGARLKDVVKDMLQKIEKDELQKLLPPVLNLNIKELKKKIT
jgi:hypothetical protein